MAALRLGSFAYLFAALLATHALAAYVEDGVEEDMAVALLQIEQLSKAEEQREARPMPQMLSGTLGSFGGLGAVVQEGASGELKPFEETVPGALRQFSNGHFMEAEPEQMTLMMATAMRAAEAERAKKEQAQLVAQQQTANWVSAMFSDKAAGDEIDATDANQLVEKIVEYVQQEDSASHAAQEQTPRLFFTDNRLQALTHAMDLDKQQALRERAAKQTELFAVPGGLAVQGKHQGYSQAFDLLPEPDHPEEAGQKWHIEVEQKQAASDKTVSVLGHGVVEHHMRQE